MNSKTIQMIDFSGAIIELEAFAFIASVNALKIFLQLLVQLKKITYLGKTLYSIQLKTNQRSQYQNLILNYGITNTKVKKMHIVSTLNLFIFI